MMTFMNRPSLRVHSTLSVACRAGRGQSVLPKAWTFTFPKIRLPNPDEGRIAGIGLRLFAE
jgi:hypothetical protein